MRQTVALIILLLLVGGVGVIVGRSVAPPRQPPMQRELEVDSGLNRMVDAVDFREKPFGEVVDELRDKTKANLTVRWRAVEAAGIEPTTPVTLRVANLPLKRVLELAFAEVGKDTVVLDVRATRGAIVVTTGEDLAASSELRLYDVRDLTRAHHDYLVSQGWKPATRPAGGGQGLLFAQNNLGSTPEQDAVETITRMIGDFVEPDMWRDAGGTVASIRELDGRLLIEATPSMHDQIVDLLRLLREGK